MSRFLRRLGAHSRSIVVAAVAFALIMAVAVPAFGASASTVKIRVADESSTLFDAVRTVGQTAFVDSSGNSYAPTSAPTPLEALAIASQQGGFPFLVHDYGWAIMVNSINGEAAVDRAWMLWVNNRVATVGADAIALKAGDSVLWSYSPFTISDDGYTAIPALLPTEVKLSNATVATGSSLTVTAWQYSAEGTRTPLAGATVHVGSMVATSSADGTVALPMNHTGDFGVRVVKTGFVPSTTSTVHVRKAATVTRPVLSKKSIHRGGYVVVRSTLKSGSTRLADRTVRLWHRAKGTSTWVSGPAKTTGPAGGVTFVVRPTRSMYYRIRYDGSKTYKAVTSAATLVTVR